MLMSNTFRCDHHTPRRAANMIDTKSLTQIPDITDRQIAEVLLWEILRHVEQGPFYGYALVTPLDSLSTC